MSTDIAGKAKAGMAHSDCRRTCVFPGKTARSLENIVPYLIASELMIHDQALYKV